MAGLTIGGLQNHLNNIRGGGTAIGAETGSNPTQAAAATEIQSSQSSDTGSSSGSGNRQSQAAQNLIDRPKGSWSNRTKDDDDDYSPAPAAPEPETVEPTPESSGLEVTTRKPSGSSGGSSGGSGTSQFTESLGKIFEQKQQEAAQPPSSGGMEVRQNNIPGGSTTRTDPVPSYINPNTGEVKQPLVSELIGKGIEAGADAVKDTAENLQLAGKITFTDETTGKPINRPLMESIPAWNEAGVSYEKQAAAFGTAVGLAALPLGASTQIGGRVIGAAVQAAPKVIGAAGRTAGGLFGFGTLASIGGETDASKITSEWSDGIKETSTRMINSAGNPLEKTAANILAVPMGAVGGFIEGAGAIPSAFIGAGKLASGILNPVATVDTFLGGADASARGFLQWIDDSKSNPAYAIGETVGFSGAYKGATSGLRGGLQTAGKYTGVIDTNIVDTGNLVISQNPLLSAALSSGAAESDGFVRLDTAPKVSAQGTSINVLPNVGTRVTVKTPGGKELLSFGRSNPLTAEGELDLQRSQSEYQTYANQAGVPFIYGAPTFKGAGTVEGFLDKTPAYLSTKAVREAVSATLPIPTPERAGRVLSYDSSNPVRVSGIVQRSETPYTPGQFSEFYKFGKLQEIDSGKFPETLARRSGVTPLPTPKQAAGGGKMGGSFWLTQSEKEQAFTTPDLTNPQFPKTSFGGFTATGLPITKLGSDSSILRNFQGNLMRNIRTVRNPAARSSKESGYNPRNAPRDFVEMYGRDVAFRLAELVGKPAGRIDITAHGSAHVENVARLASSLKKYQTGKYQKVSDEEIFFAGILHDAAKNTAYESVPGGHGEMVGSVLRSGVSLDARDYLKPAARKEFESILGAEGTGRLNDFLDRWERLSPKQQKNIANAVSQHTTNLKGAFSQVQRLTSNKLGRLISDADRIELRRFADNPAEFSPKAWKMFASQDVVRKATQDVYGSAPEIRIPGAPKLTGARRAADNTQPKTRDSQYAAYTYSTPGRAYGYAVPKAPGAPKIPGDYDYTKETGPGGYLAPAGYTPGRGYPGSSRYPGSSTYKGIGYSASRRAAGTPYKGNPLKEDLFQEVRRKRDDDEKGKEATYNRIRIGTRRHLGIADPLEFTGLGSATKRGKRGNKSLDKVTIKDELTWKKRPVYEFDGGYSARKPKGRTRRR